MNDLKKKKVNLVLKTCKRCLKPLPFQFLSVTFEVILNRTGNLFETNPLERSRSL
jgi:hypothetical protein